MVALQGKRGPVVALDQYPELGLEELFRSLARRFETLGSKPLDVGLVGLLNKRLIPVVLAVAGISDTTRPCSSVSEQETRRLAGVLKDWVLPVTGSQSWHDAQVAAGGIRVDEVDPGTLESRLMRGFYLCGEVLDVDGDCGGFNLQWAWSSGWVAGRHAALD